MLLLVCQSAMQAVSAQPNRQQDQGDCKFKGQGSEK